MIKRTIRTKLVNERERSEYPEYDGYIVLVFSYRYELIVDPALCK